MTDEPFVVLENVTVRFGRKEVLNNINLSVDKGEFCVILGPSGCGKSVALRVIAGLTRPTEGNVYIEGQLANRVPPGNRDVAMVFQSFALYPYMTVRENWTFPLKAARLPQAETEARVRAMTEFLHMGPLMNRYPRELSGGQQQRVAVGRALVRRPRIFLLDEPLGNLDAKLRVEMRTRLKRLQRDLDITTIHVTHDQVEAQALGDKIAVMDMGTVQQLGTPEEIYEQPANVFVARFIGTPRINFIDCTLQRENETLYFQHPLFKLAVPPAIATRVEQRTSGKEVILGIRPEWIELSPTEKANAIPTEVYVLEPQSNELIVDLSFGHDILKMRADRDDIGFEPQLNQKVFMSFDVSLAHVFDKESGQRLN